MNFDRWIQRVDARLVDTMGVGSKDLNGWVWLESHERGDTPEVAVVAFLEETFNEEWI